MNPRSKTNWTPVDEERFQEMVKLRDDLLTKNRKPLIDLAEDLMASLRDRPENTFAVPGVVEFFEKNADRIRDALDPFDSGDRPAKVMPYVSPPMVAPVESNLVDLSKLVAAIQRLMAIYSPDFCCFVMLELAGREKIADVDPKFFDIIIRACDAYVQYHSFYPNVTGTTFLVAAMNRMNTFLFEQMKAPLVEIVHHGAEYRGIHAQQIPGEPAKNFGDL